MYNRLIHGKSNLERVVSCEVKGSTLELFIEEADGTIRTEVKPNKYWILAPKPYDSEFKRLQGDLHYKYIKLYDDRDKWQEDRRKGRKADIYSMYDEREAAMCAFGFTYYKGMKVNEVSVLSFDIETNGLTKNSKSYLYIISNTFKKNGVVTRKMFSCDEYNTQADMIDAWCNWVREVNPSVVCGHNIYGFDIGYLQHIADISGTTLKLGRDGSELTINSYPSKFRKDGSQAYDYFQCRIFGRELVDTMFLSFKYDFSRKYPSYGLKAIIKYEGLEVKDRQFYDAGLIKDNWNNLEERKKIKAYAMFDADDALALFNLMIPSFFYLSQSIPKTFEAINYSATGSQINGFLVRSYLQEFHSIPKKSPLENYGGGLSMGFPGVYSNVVKWDVKSMYPSIMLQYDVYDRDKDPLGNFIKMVEYFTLQRFENKRLGKETGDRYYSDLDQAGKLVINSAYGMLAAEVNFNSPKLAAFVTSKGREILQTAVKWSTGKDYSEWLAMASEEKEEDV